MCIKIKLKLKDQGYITFKGGADNEAENIQKQLDEVNIQINQLQTKYDDMKENENFINSAQEELLKIDPKNFMFYQQNRKYYRTPSNMGEKDKADKFMHDFENYKHNIYIDKSNGNDALTKDFVKEHGYCNVDTNMKLVDDLFNSEKDVQLFYSELNGIEKKLSN